ncbi:flagellar FliL protein [Gemmobacter aquatilis]|uniref:Flagellar protein FliL n=2 Tax=Gemmobacter aquatilis TaxID=933059 RepID=A0A1H7Z192_9RHOB|nr:flagellar basal body-associated FliL family protein [Gemmobacter aquatilis]SEM52230.1 flagellar FliL protein [Gemmobacter aquatilis]
MAEAAQPQDAAPKKKSRMPVLIGGGLALVLGGVGFFATYKGLIFGHETAQHSDAATAQPLPAVAFVPIEPVVVQLGPAGRNQNLRLVANLEVSPAHAGEVTAMMPRILDVLNSYLRAVEIAQLQDPAALVRIRAQILRRIQVVTGEGRVRDLLITEFLMN